ncbi:MAG: hypothetical protein KIT22_01705 [Verrucomicrobiae bacterium]|nr:hypothetical protein [Verrucomicrobiae bacterium]
MVFRTGAGAGDIAVFKWTFGSGSPVYVDGRAEAEFLKSAFLRPWNFDGKLIARRFDMATTRMFPSRIASSWSAWAAT